MIALGLVLGLTACVPGGARGDEPTDPEQPSTSSPSELPATIEGDTNGDGVLSEFEKQVLAQNAPRDFTMTDGTTVQVDPEVPLPPAVKDVLTQQAQPIADQYKTNTDFSPESVGALHARTRETVEAQSEAIGKPVVFVLPSPNGAGGIQWFAVPSALKATGIIAESNRESMVDKVESWAEHRGYEVIVLG